MIRPLWGFGLALAVVAGCGPKPEDESQEDSGPPKVAFEGKVDPALVGTWATADQSSVLVLGKDGKLDLTSIYPTPKGKRRAKKNGGWLLNGDRILLKYAETDGAESVVGYAMKRTGETMTLSTKIPKRDTVYKRR